MIEINGIQYIKKEVTYSKQKDLTINNFALAMLLESSQYIFSGFGNGGTSLNGKVNNCNIIKEFGLIELKKSNLSKSQRDWVIKEFNKTYQKV